MKKNKIVLSALIFAFLVTTFAPFAFAATYNGNSTTMTFDVLAGGASNMPYPVCTNPNGEYCTKDTRACFQVNNVTSNYNIQNVYFEIYGSSYYNNTSSTITIPGSSVGSSSWWGLFDWDGIGVYDTYTVTAYAKSADNNVYSWTKIVKHDTIKPTLTDISIYSHGNYMSSGSDGNPVVDNNITVNFSVSDYTPYRTSWVKEVSIQVLTADRRNVLREVIMTNGLYQNLGSYSTNFELLSLGSVEKKLVILVIATDYAGNRISSYKYFGYDKANARGYLTKGAITNTTVEYIFTSFADVSGVMYPSFYM